MVTHSARWNQFHQRATNTNQRLLDYFTLHCYPQGGEFTDDVSASMQALRNRSTRQLWDTNYVDQSWIGQQAQNNIIMLIPRMRNWVNTYYPGTKIGITEYNWGAEKHINGATAQADIYGIFGREGLDMGTRWTTPDTGTFAYNAMKLYRNYDGAKSTFGDTSVQASAPNPDTASVFASVRSADNALTIIAINKQSAVGARVDLNLTNFPAGAAAQAWQLNSANAITRLSDAPLVNGNLTNAVPPASITLYIVPFLLPAASNPSPASGLGNVGVTTNLTWSPGANARGYRVFFGVSSNAVAIATTNSSEFKGVFADANFTPPTLAFGTTYYWRIEETNGLFATSGPVWSFSTAVLAGAATNPNPPNNAINVSTNLALSWTPGVNATAHRVYYGASAAAISAATTNSPEYKGTFAAASYNAGAQAANARFYWRIDEIVGAQVVTGAIWTYATQPETASALRAGGGVAGNSFVLAFPSQYGQMYRVEQTDQLIPPSWSVVADQLSGTGSPLQVTNANAGSRYYRIVLLAP